MRTYTLNENFFGSWSYEMAYTFGFLVADGNLFHEGGNAWRISMGLKSLDKHILESINKMMESNRPIYDHFASGVSQMRFHSKIMADDLKSLGLTERKSLDMPWLTSVPAEFMAPYVRGFFDGDGSVFLIKHPSAKRNYIGINFTGTKEYLEGLQQEINKIIGREYGHIRALKVKSGFYYQLVYSGDATAKLFFDWIYEGSTPETRLSRKYDLVQSHYASLSPEQLSDQRRSFARAEEVHETWVITAFGEEKTLSEWSMDKRCIVSRGVLYHRIIKQELEPEFAMTTPVGDIEAPNHAPDVLSNASTINWDIVKEIRARHQAGETVEVISTDLNYTESLIHDVVQNRSWVDPDYTPRRTKSTNILKVIYQDKEYTLTELSALTGVPKPTIDRRLREGKTVEQAVQVEAFEKVRTKPVQVGRAGMTAEKVKSLRQDYLDGIRGQKAMEKHEVSKSAYIDITGNRTWKEDTVWWK